MSYSGEQKYEQRAFLPDEARAVSPPSGTVSPALLQWAVERFGNRAELERRFPKLSRWLDGAELPTVRQLEAFARATLTPFGYFFLPEPPREEIAIPDFRVRSGKPLRLTAKMQALIGMLQIRQEWLSEYRQRSGRPRLEFIGKFDATVAPQKAARDMRAVLRLPDDWPRASSTRADALATLANQAEAAGVVVVFNSVLGNNTHQRLREEDFSGFALVDQYAPFIFINTGRERAKAAQIFTLAHELAHLWLGQSGISRVTLGQEAGQEIERACNRIAAAFLMPEALFRAAWQELHQEPLQEMTYRLSEQWKVSRAAIVVRALELNLLDRVQGDTLLEELRSSYEEREEKAAHAGGDFYRMQMRRLGRPFVEAVIEALEEEELSYREAEELLDVRAKALTRLLDRFTPS